MTRLADQDYLAGGPSNARVAHFSPDGKRFVVILRKGNLEQNTNEFMLLLFGTDDALHSPKPVVLRRMVSASNRDAIRDIRWLQDNETIVFLGENLGDIPQVCLLNVRTKHFEEITNHRTEIYSYDITSDGREIIYNARPSKNEARNAEGAYRGGVVIEGQDLADILEGDYSSGGDEVFLEVRGHAPVPIPINKGLVGEGPLSLSRDGRYALVGVGVREVPPEWRRYGGFVQQVLEVNHLKGSILPFKQYLLVDLETKTSSLLVNAPAATVPIWSEDGAAVFLKTYLPLDVTNHLESGTRDKGPFDVEVKIPTKEIEKVPPDKRPNVTDAKVEVEITIDEDANTPQEIYATDPKTNTKSLLMDLNPQFRELQFGKVEIIGWKVNNTLEVQGGLYLPPDYEASKRYPLVIQTHGFAPKEFSMDGAREWSSAYAARPLAAMGFIVLQLFAFENQSDHDHFNDKNEFGVTREQAGRNINVAAIRRAIEFLDDKKMIDRQRIGIVGFSRTVCIVAFLLTHSQEPFAAASLVDGIDCGYFQEMAFPGSAWDVDKINGGASPFGTGLRQWLKESPSFNLDKVRTPVRLLALGSASVLEAWEWYAGLSLQHKPVDFILLPDAAHFAVKPKERMVAQQGLVDWFRFWLKGEEDSDPNKAEQYARWRELRRLQQDQTARDSAETKR